MPTSDRFVGPRREATCECCRRNDAPQDEKLCQSCDLRADADSFSVVQQVLGAQADLQVALGMWRLMKVYPPKTEEAARNYDELTVDRMERALAQLHKLLHELGMTMYQSATHPEVWNGPEEV